MRNEDIDVLENISVRQIATQRKYAQFEPYWVFNPQDKDDDKPNTEWLSRVEEKLRTRDWNPAFYHEIDMRITELYTKTDYVSEGVVGILVDSIRTVFKGNEEKLAILSQYLQGAEFNDHPIVDESFFPVLDVPRSLWDSNEARKYYPKIEEEEKPLSQIISDAPDNLVVSLIPKVRRTGIGVNDDVDRVRLRVSKGVAKLGKLIGQPDIHPSMQSEKIEELYIYDVLYAMELMIPLMEDSNGFNMPLAGMSLANKIMLFQRDNHNLSEIDYEELLTFTTLVDGKTNYTNTL